MSQKAKSSKNEVRKSGSAKPEVAEVVPPPSFKYRDRVYGYYPELSTWQALDSKDPLHSRSFEIHELNSENDQCGIRIATVHVSPESGYYDAEKVVRLMAAAPALFRALQRIAPHALGTLEGVADFNHALAVMFNALGKYPYESPSIPNPERSRRDAA